MIKSSESVQGSLLIFNWSCNTVNQVLFARTLFKFNYTRSSQHKNNKAPVDNKLLVYSYTNLQ